MAGGVDRGLVVQVWVFASRAREAAADFEACCGIIFNFGDHASGFPRVLGAFPRVPRVSAPGPGTKTKYIFLIISHNTAWSPTAVGGAGRVPEEATSAVWVGACRMMSKNQGIQVSKKEPVTAENYPL